MPLGPGQFTRATKGILTYQFLDQIRLPLDLTGKRVLDLAASVEPNLKATSLAGVNISLSDKDISKIQSAADFIYAQKLSASQLKNVRKHINTDLLKKAVKELAAAPGTDYLTRIKPLSK